MPDRSQKITFAQMRGGAGTRRRSLALLNSQSPLLGYFTEREVGAIIERGVLVTVARPGVRQGSVQNLSHICQATASVWKTCG